MGTPVVLITGVLTRIRRTAARAFAGEGNRIVVAGRHATAGQELAAELRELGAEVEFLRADVRKEDDVRNLIDRTVARFGRLDAAVNNAGTEGQPGPVTQQTAETYAATFDTNLLGTLLSMKHELRVMQAQGSGSIVNISSTYGHEGASGISLRCQQARRRRHDEVRGARSCALRGARQRCGSRSDRYRNAESLHRNPAEEGGAGHGSTAGARKASFRDWPGPHRRWRQDRGLTAIKRR
jgi:NAD(P)-dependent dehydrogenase (short-subunit alcohol dehydrogenase family)